MRIKIQQLLVDLRLKGIAQTLDLELDRVDKKGTSVCEVIYRLLRQRCLFYPPYQALDQEFARCPSNVDLPIVVVFCFALLVLMIQAKNISGDIRQDHSFQPVQIIKTV